MKTLRWIIMSACLSQIVVNLEAQYVFINQAGYLPDQAKYAYFIFPEDSFYVVAKATGIIEFSGLVQLNIKNDPSTGSDVYRGDFSSFKKEGTYQIVTPGSDTSYVFSISPSVYESVYKKSLKGFYFQRCGQPLFSENAGVYARTQCHMNDGTFHSTTGKTGTAVTTGGWHDAGDYGKYVVNAGISVWTLLYAYELFPHKINYDDLNIPESGNSVPDILDEARYELHWLLKMQDTSDGGVYFKVTTAQFDAFEMPAQDNSIRFIYQKSTTATGDFAALMAQAARIYSPFDATFAAQCLTAARLAWQYLFTNTSIVPTGGFHNPSGTGTGEYGDGDDSDERLWAATELFETTGETEFHDYFKAHYSTNGIFSSTMSWPYVKPMAQLAYLTGTQTASDTLIKNQLKTSLYNYCTSLANIVTHDGFNVSLYNTSYNWGCNGAVLNNAILLIVGAGASNMPSFGEKALQQINYILGCNRLNMSFVTGVGSKYPLHIHHRPSGADGILEPVPGLMAGGPDSHLDDAVLYANFTSSTPPALCYSDDQGSYASNEICINWNAPLVFVAGYFNESQNTSVKEVHGQQPSNIILSQNFPNPFNPTTRISFYIPDKNFVTLKIFDLLGREIVVLINGQKPAGIHSMQWNAVGFPSGTYFYRLQAGSFIETKKLVLLK